MKSRTNNRSVVLLLTGVVGPSLLAGCASGGGPVGAEAAAGTASAIADSIRTGAENGVSANPREPAVATTAVTADYIIGPDDLVEVNVFGAENLGGEVRVTSGGEVSLPLLGSVTAAGLTPPELEAVIQKRLGATYMKDPAVSVQVLERRVHTVYVVGEVVRPGGFPLSRGDPMSVLQALALAGGLGPTADQDGILIYRGGGGSDREEVAVDLEKVLDGSTADPLLHPRDILFVPNSRIRSVARGFLEAFVRVFTLRGLLY